MTSDFSKQIKKENRDKLNELEQKINILTSNQGDHDELKLLQTEYETIHSKARKGLELDHVFNGGRREKNRQNIFIT